MREHESGNDLGIARRVPNTRRISLRYSQFKKIDRPVRSIDILDRFTHSIILIKKYKSHSNKMTQEEGHLFRIFRVKLNFILPIKTRRYTKNGPIYKNYFQTYVKNPFFKTSKK